MVSRIAERETLLPGGVRIPKGASVGVANYEMRSAWSPFFENAHVFDGYRFSNIRKQTGNQTWTQFVSTGEQHMGFGYGKYACPGRFFAADAIKVFMCHVILKYDFELPSSNPRPRFGIHGWNLEADPKAQIMVRKRCPEIDLDEF